MVESTYNPFHVSHLLHTTCSDAPQEATLQILMYHRRLADFANDVAVLLFAAKSLFNGCQGCFRKCYTVASQTLCFFGNHAKLFCRHVWVSKSRMHSIVLRW